MSTTTQTTNTSMLTWQEIEKSIINILRAGIFYNKDKKILRSDFDSVKHNQAIEVK